MVQSLDHSLRSSFLRVECRCRLVIRNERSQGVWKHVEACLEESEEKNPRSNVRPRVLIHEIEETDLSG